MRRLLAAASLAVLVTAGCSEDGPNDRLTVGSISQGGAFVAFATEGNRFVAYVCDGGPTASWFEGDVVGDSFQASSVSGDAISGTIGPTVDGTYIPAGGAPLAFETTNARGDASLWRAEFSADGKDYLGGWIVQAGGEQRGAVGIRSTSKVVENPTLNISDGTSNTFTSGTVQATQIVSPRDIVSPR